MSASVSNAELYFAPTNHIQASSWARYQPDQKQAAIVQAKRLLNRAYTTRTATQTVVDIEHDLARLVAWGLNPEYAIYEQALFMLQNQPMFNADETMAVAEAADPESPSKARRPNEAVIAPEALRWLTTSTEVELSRG